MQAEGEEAMKGFFQTLPDIIGMARLAGDYVLNRSTKS